MAATSNILEEKSCQIEMYDAPPHYNGLQVSRKYKVIVEFYIRQISKKFISKSKHAFLRFLKIVNLRFSFAFDWIL